MNKGDISAARAIIDNVLYDTEASLLLAHRSDDYSDSLDGIVKTHTRALYRMKRGRFFLVTHAEWRDPHVRVCSIPAAISIHQNSVSRPCPFQEAFPKELLGEEGIEL